MDGGGVVAFLKVGRSFFLPQGTARSSQSQPAGSQRLGAPVLDFYVWLPPPKKKQVSARLQLSPQRGAAQRNARSSRPDSSRLTCYYARDAFPRRPVSPRVCASHRSRATAPRSHPCAPWSTQSSLPVQTHCQPCCPEQESRTRAAGIPGPPEGSPDSGGGRQEEPAGARSSGPTAETPAGSPLSL